MLNYLRKLFGLCVHDFSNWKEVSTKSSDYGDFIVVQQRYCKNCNFMEFHKTQI